MNRQVFFLHHGFLFINNKSYTFISMQTIQTWVYNLLVSWGLINDSSSLLDNFVILLLIILLTIGIDYVCRYFVLGMFRRLAEKTKNTLDDLIIERKIINKIIHIITQSGEVLSGLCHCCVATLHQCLTQPDT